MKLIIYIGCVRIHEYRTIIVSISQESCPRLLEAIAMFVHCGTVSNRSYNITGRNARAFLMWIRPYLVEKQEQVDVALQWKIDHDAAKTKEEQDKLYAIADSRLKHLKHEGTIHDPHKFILHPPDASLRRSGSRGKVHNAGTSKTQDQGPRRYDLRSAAKD